MNSMHNTFARLHLPANPMFRSTLRRALLPLLTLNTVIAVGITVFGEHTLGANLLYSQCIGLCIAGLIDVGRYLLIREGSKHMPRLVAVVPLSVVLGFVCGSLLADTLLGNNTAQYWANSPNKALGMLFVSLVAGAALTYFFVSRELLAVAQKNAEAAQRQAAESRLKLLETQLEPHMLFNTLANLRALMAQDPARAQTMLDHLIAYLRATLSASQSTNHTLAQEFDRLRDYLELMAVRMGTRLRFALDLPAELANLPVPTLLLQPLVENSIKHGLEPKVEGGSVMVRARRAGHSLLLEVTDTGLGPGKSAALLPSASQSGGFGLAQVRERLGTVFGADAAIILVATEVGGTSVVITIPLQP